MVMDRVRVRLSVVAAALALTLVCARPVCAQNDAATPDEVVGPYFPALEPELLLLHSLPAAPVAPAPGLNNQLPAAAVAAPAPNQADGHELQLFQCPLCQSAQLAW